MVAPLGECYEVKAGMVYLQGKSCVIRVNAGVAGNTVRSTPERIRGEVLTTMLNTN